MAAPRKSGWSPERRAKQAERIREWAPWEKSSGPKTDAGKSAASKNADKGGQRVALRGASRALRMLKKAIKERRG